MDKKWSNFYQQHGRFYLLPHPALKSLIHKCRQRGIKKILDLGCGSGRNLVRLAEEGFQVSGLDFSPSAAQLAEKWLHQKGVDGDIIVGNFDDKTKDFPDKSFGAAIAINSLEYADLDELKRNLLQINRLLKPEGILLLVYRSKGTKIKHPEVETLFLEQDQLEKEVGRYFHVSEISKDNDKNFVVFAEKMRYISNS